jgi:hypothetical protein
VSILSLVATLIMLIVTGAYVTEVTEAASVRARAQTAADSAALAAAAEAAPYGDSSPYSAALRFARLNDGELTDCICHPGALAVQVEVTVGGVTASARAVIDPTRFMPAAPGDLDPRLQAAVDELLAAGGGRIWLGSGYRTPERQVELWEDALARYGDPELADDWVARPGTSMHERGLAVDLGGDAEHAWNLVHELGLPLVRPMSWEPWHFELTPSMGG